MEEEIKKRTTLKKVKRFLVISGTVLAVLIVTGIILANVYEKEIKKFAIDEINSNLKGSILVSEDDVSFSFLSSFPKASLNFKNLLIQEENKKDTILFANNLALKLGIFEVLSGKYRVNQIKVSDGEVNLSVDLKGKENYIFWKTENTDTTSSEISLDLEKVNFENVSLTYENNRSHYYASLFLNNTVFSGSFSNDTSRLQINSSHQIEQLRKDSLVYFENKESEMEVQDAVFTSDSILLKGGMLKIEEMALDVEVKFDLKKENSKLIAKATNVEISDVFTLMPQEVSEKLKTYKSKGKVFGDVVVDNEKKWKEPKVLANFWIKDGTVTEQNSGVNISNLILKGNFSSSSFSQRVEVQEGKGNLSGSEFTLSGKLIGKNSRTIFINLNGDFDLEKLSEFLNIEEIETMEGQVSINNKFQGTIFSRDKISVSEFSGKAKLTDASMKLKSNENQFDGFNGEVTFNRFTSNATFTGTSGNSDFSVSTQFSNFIPYLLNNKELSTNIYVQSKTLELDKLIGNTKEKIEDGTDTTGVKFPKRMKANLRINVERLLYQKHELNNLVGSVTLSNTQLKSDRIKFNSNDGSYTLSGVISKQGNEFTLNSDITCAQIDVSDFLKKFDDFGQTTLRYEHLSGNANAIVKLKANMSKHLEIDVGSLDAKTEFSIANGELKDLELFDEIGDYLKSNIISKSIVKVDELAKKLRKVKFSEFTNTLQIKNRKITIPSMFIETSAMDISLYGTQTFNFDINYGISIRLKDILTKKKDTEYGYIVDDGTGARLFLLVTGTVDEPKFKLDKKGRKEYNQEKREEEKNNIKGILKDEFGLYKNHDTDTDQSKKEKPKPKFEVDWGEEEEEPAKKETPKSETEETPKKPKKKSWLDKLREKEKSKEENKKPEFKVE